MTSLGQAVNQREHQEQRANFVQLRSEKAKTLAKLQDRHARRELSRTGRDYTTSLFNHRIKSKLKIK